MDTKRPKDEKSLRHLAENELGRTIPEGVWMTQVEEGLIENTLQGLQGSRREQTRSDFLDALRRDLKLYDRSQEDHRREKSEMRLEEMQGILTEYEAERAEAVAERLAKYLSCNKKIRNFREEILGGDRRLSREEVDVFINSEAVRYASRSHFRRYGIPLIDHQATFIEERQEIERGEEYYIIKYLTEPNNMSAQLPFEVRLSTDNWARLDWVHKDSIMRPIIYRKESLLDEVVVCAEVIVRETRCVQQVAILCLLTGIGPLVQPISVRLNMMGRNYNQYNSGSISMVIEPWVSAESVMKTYRQLQQYLLNRTNRPMISKNGQLHGIEIFRFFTQQMKPVPGKSKSWDDDIYVPTWRELSEAWNKIHPDRQRDYRNFRKEYKRAEQFIMLPPYRGLE